MTPYIPPCKSKLYWIIEKGDTFYFIAKKTGTTVTTLIRLNPHMNPYNLQIGERICLPSK